MNLGACRGNEMVAAEAEGMLRALPAGGLSGHDTDVVRALTLRLPCDRA